ncbi:NAD(P)-dependent dehydrogenase, short-chain alcohol dehydrogenase family [Pasteurella multocida]|uniref:D-mannonate oxidoreductase n=2 Tax=Pasteurella multocida TaxID=747 RepID=A0A849CJ93_PASMD|nr:MULTISPECIES: SDR family oxidoreductase [Pasteurella]EGP03138.1 D-mannonate oxidoreductase [Pasteurella multocida subsp. gallicida str. Anand1_poultry]AFI46780.1 D-mannonate oxidoreductase [Pasteurella multocida subsp. multocida str. 3480]AMM82358.1 D-mannonate oxidoreductase [Pasteurella multocida subsp. multocida PMTB2.1]APW57062.1 D-mannonate oxidoreductase [Pasteurella multocida]ARB73973.1 D-mannonate oxidoreductase [Pasteurella multocida]
MQIPFNHQFKDKVIVITGAGGVLCGFLSKQLAKTGAKIALLDINLEMANYFAEEINQSGGIAKGYQTNVLELSSIQATNEQIKQDFGSCDILINGAGGNNPKATTDNEFHEFELPEKTKSFFDLDKSGVEFVFNLNYLGTLLPTQVFVKEMIGKQGCCIINISSMNAFTPLTKIPAYSGAKAAISNFTQWLAVHFSHVGIRCNAIAPGFLVSNQNRTLLFNTDGSPTARAHKILTNTPMGRFGEAEELVGGILFLIDERYSSFVNGVVLPIDGGFSAYSGV